MACIKSDVVYALFNLKAPGSCMDLSGGDNVSVIGFEFHNGPNQAWIFNHTGQEKTYTIKSVGANKYLSPDCPALDGQRVDGQRVVALDTPFSWRVEDEPGVNLGVRLLPASEAHFCVDLSDNGNPKPGTPVQLWRRWAPGQNQVWKLHQIN